METLSDFFTNYKQDLEIVFSGKELPEELNQKYEIAACLKETQDKSVYIVRSKTTGKRFILKVRPFNSHELLQHEYELIASLNSLGCIGIPKVFGYYETPELVFMLEEYIDGITLYDSKEAGRVFSREELVALMRQLCHTLTFLHSQPTPLIHRDITPKNLMMTKQSKLYLIDFETTRSYSDQKSSDTICMGTAAFSSPEQFGYHQTDARSDIYSMGMVIFYLLTGSTERDPSLLEVLPKDLSKVVLKCTEFSPEKRFLSVTALDRRLAKLEPDEIKLRHHFMLICAHIGFAAVLLVLFLCIKQSPSRTEITPPDINAYLSQPVIFHEPLIEQAVRSSLDIDTDAPVTLMDLLSVTSLSICADTILSDPKTYDYFTESRINNTLVTAYGTISDLSDLSYMTNLKELILANESITDLSPLANLHLTTLLLPGNQITDLSIIAGLDSIETLNISDNPIADLSILSYATQNGHLGKLTDLSISCLDLNSLSFLSDLSLDTFYCMNIQIRDGEYAPLGCLTHLKFLRTNLLTEEQVSYLTATDTLTVLQLYSSSLRNLNCISRFLALQELHLHGSQQLSSLSGIESLKELNYLGIGNTLVSDLQPLLALYSLTSLDISNCPIQDYSVLGQLNNISWMSYSQDQAASIPERLQ